MSAIFFTHQSFKQNLCFFYTLINLCMGEIGIAIRKFRNSLTVTVIVSSTLFKMITSCSANLQTTMTEILIRLVERVISRVPYIGKIFFPPYICITLSMFLIVKKIWLKPLYVKFLKLRKKMELEFFFLNAYSGVIEKYTIL